MGDLSQLFASLRILIAQHRRLFAAGCAGLAVLLFLSTFQGASSAPALPGTPDAFVSSLSSSEVAVPILLADTQLAGAVQLGNTVRLIQLLEGSEPAVISESARVMSKGSTSHAFSAGDAALIVVAVPQSESLQVAAAGASASLTLVVKSAHS
jgi:hypothetical protein